MSEKELQLLRREIDRIDAGILSLLNRRTKTSARIGARKKRLGRAPYDPSREKEILARLKSLNRGLLPAPAIDFIFGEILSACRSAFRPIRVAYPGPAPSPGRTAGINNFGRSARFLSCSGNPGVFRALQAGRADYGIVVAPGKKAVFPPDLTVVKKGTFPGRAGKKEKFIVLRARSR
ncbi:MAG: chorismate mutase [Proteobacteria bacterium]|nr:chorismate mutase [Pseudomonadota bacterium]